MHNGKYTLSIHIAAPGTPLFDNDGLPLLIKGTNKQETSLPGHMFYSLQKTTKNQLAMALPLQQPEDYGDKETRKMTT